MSKAHISLGPGRNAKVCLDDTDITRGLRGFTLTADVHSVPELALNMAIFDHEVEGEVKVLIPQHTQEALVALGWTPPDAQPDPHRSAPALAPSPG